MSPAPGLAQVARAIGQSVAAAHADDVDQAARFPAETVAELRRSGLLGALVPVRWGGPGASVQDLAGAVTVLAEHCASSGLVLAMHGIQVACIVRHAAPQTLERVVPALLAGDLLLANANSEVGLGGERRSSLCALEATEGGYRLEKRAATVSYGEFADGVLATARRTPDSPPTDQVFAICLGPDLSLVPTGDWDTLGLRGTCSRPAQLSATLPPELVIEDYADVFARTSLPASAILLSAVWQGIAEAAARRAHAVVRRQARKLRVANPDAPPPPGALRLAELTVLLYQLRAAVSYGATEYERVKDTPEVVTMGFSGTMDNLKVSSSTLVIDVVRQAMAICGLAGYTNTSPSSLARHARDAAAAPLMVNNDRALIASSESLLIRKEL
ncbi:MAG TPA: acyl-CoA dehydrogenase family protein [Thermomicrobiaceae bacterium]|nr:acyl-CoA dehydrogenase family protein [Thermomicrobiaceae bacterium]